MSGLVLSLFPGIGLLDRAFEEEGFCVVRGPDLLWGGDIHTFHPPAGKFDGVIGGPPCQMFSALRHIVLANGYELAPNLIPEFERVVSEAQPTWFLMENVPAAPAPNVARFFVSEHMVTDAHVGGATSRTRRFCFGTRTNERLRIEFAALHTTQPRPAILASGGNRDRPVKIGGSGKVKHRHSGKQQSNAYFARALEDTGLPPDFLSESPFTVAGKIKCVGNGVPLPMGRAVARATKEAILR